MPFVYFGIGWLIGIWVASALQLPTEVFLALTIVPIGGFLLWRTDRRAILIWISVAFAIAGGVRYNLSISHFDQNSLATYNNIGEVTIGGVIEADPDLRDTYINLRVKADRGHTARSSHSSRRVQLWRSCARERRVDRTARIGDLLV